MTAADLTPAQHRVRGIMQRVAAGGTDALEVMVMLTTMAREHWRVLLPMAFAHRPPVIGWQLLLLKCWREDSSAVVAAAGENRETVRAWFAFADFRNCTVPIFAPYIAKALPAEQVMYRGGQGDPDQLAQGFSWTPRKGEAGWYAYRRTVRPGPPVIIRRKVRREEIALQMASWSREAVVLSPGYDGVLKITPADRAVLVDLARRSEARDAAARWPEMTTAECRRAVGLS